MRTFLFYSTTVQSNLAKGLIAILSPLPAANEFVRSLPHITHGSLYPQESASKRHLDRFCRFCTAHTCNHHTDRHTDHATCDICSNRPHQCSACRRCGLQILKPVAVNVNRWWKLSFSVVKDCMLRRTRDDHNVTAYMIWSKSKRCLTACECMSCRTRELWLLSPEVLARGNCSLLVFLDWKWRRRQRWW